MRTPAARYVLTSAERTELRNLVLQHGERAVCESTGLSTQALARLIAGLEVRSSTFALARLGTKKALAELGSSPRSLAAEAESLTA